MASNVVDTIRFFAQCSECRRSENFKLARVNGRCNQDSHKRCPNVLIFSLSVKVNEIHNCRSSCLLAQGASMGTRTNGGEIMELKDDMLADLANSLKADEEDRRRDHAPLVAGTENEEVATLTVTIETNLRQRRQAYIAQSELGDKDDLEEVRALLFRFLGYGFRLAMSTVGWLVTQKFVILVPDPIGFAPESVLLGPGEPCDNCALVNVDSSPRCGGSLLSHLLSQVHRRQAARGGEREGRLRLDEEVLDAPEELP